MMVERNWEAISPTLLTQSLIKVKVFQVRCLTILIRRKIMVKGIIKVVIALIALGTGVELGRRGLADIQNKQKRMAYRTFVFRVDCFNSYFVSI